MEQSRRCRLGRMTIVVLALILASCAGGVRAVQPGPYVVDEAFQVRLGKAWSVLPGRLFADVEGDVMTLDGPLLNRLHMVGGLADGDSLLKTRRKKDEERLPVYRADMTTTEIIELISDSVVAWGYTNVETTTIEPRRFGKNDGVRYDFTADTPAGLNIQGAALINQSGETLNLILFLAPKEHYFTAARGEIEKIMSSAVVL